MSTLVEAADEDGLLSDSELVAMAVLLFVAGTETTVSLIATAITAPSAADSRNRIRTPSR